MLFLYPAQIAVDFDTGMPVIDRRSQVGQVVRRGTPSTVPTIYEDQAGTIIIPSAQRTATDQGMVAPFYIDETFGPVSWYSDGVEYPLQSVEGIAKRQEEVLALSQAARTEAATSAIEAANTAATVAALDSWVKLGVTRYNRCLNPRGVGTGTPWAFNGGAGEAGTVSYVTTAGGRTAARVTCTATDATGSTNAGNWFFLVPPPHDYVSGGGGYFPVAEGQVLSARVRAWFSKATVNAHVKIGWRTSGGSVFLSWSAEGPKVIAPAGDAGSGVLLSVTNQIAPPGATHAYVVVFGGYPEYGQNLTVGDWAGATDALIMTQSSLPDYFDGDTPDTDIKGYAWSGAPNASVSQMIDMAAISSDLVAEAKAAREAAEAAANANLPTGGTTGQVLMKDSGADRDVVWATVSGGGGGGATEWGSVLNKPPTFPPSGHSHPMSQVSDMKALARQIGAADTAQEIRALIGAGTGNGTSNLTLGGTATTAAPGNHAHSASAITFAPTGTISATNLQDAVTQAAATGGSGGASNVYVWRYAAGAYPTPPVTKPAGCEMVVAIGPVAPTSYPSWMGSGPGQVPTKVEINLALA